MNYLNEAEILLNLNDDRMTTDLYGEDERDVSVKQLVKVLLLLHAGERMGKIVGSIARTELNNLLDDVDRGMIDRGFALSTDGIEWLSEHIERIKQTISNE